MPDFTKLQIILLIIWWLTFANSNFSLNSNLQSSCLVLGYFELGVLIINGLLSNCLVVILPQLLEDSLEERLEKAGVLLSDSEKGEGDAKEGENDESKVLLVLKWISNCLSQAPLYLTWCCMLIKIYELSDRVCMTEYIFITKLISNGNPFFFFFFLSP